MTPLARRHFLIGAAGLTSLAAGGGANGAPTAQGQPMPSGMRLPEPANKRVRYAVVGLGGFAVGQVLPAMLDSQNSRVTAFVSGSPQKAKDLGARYGVSKIYDYAEFDKIAQDDEIDCVYIALPVGLHADYTIRALKAGKHVLCEKPMASTVAECEAMVAAAKAANKQLGIAYRVHFEPNNIEAVRILRAGQIGTIRHYSGDSGFDANPDFPPHKWRLTKALGGGGSMYDIGIYALNAALMCIDEAPTSVRATYTTPANDPRFKEVEGGVDWHLRFASGVTAQGSSSYAYAYVTRQRIFGTLGALDLDPASEYENVTLSLLTGDGRREIIHVGDPASQFAAQLDGFSEAAMANKPHRTPGEMGLRDIKLIQAIYRSADADGKAVAL
jgi:predicted dehydrogenase